MADGMIKVIVRTDADGFSEWSAEVEVAEDTTIEKFKELLALPPHAMAVKASNKVLWKSSNGILMSLRDNEKVRRAMVLHAYAPVEKNLPFPPDFMWGSATSAYQIEGAAKEGGRTPSIWDTFAETPGKVKGDDTGAEACQHYHRFREDVRIMADLHLPYYRFSISWSRVLPLGVGAPNPEGVAFYNELIDELRSHKITPIVTLYHWDLPQCLEDQYGGWLDKRVIDDFEHYAAVCFESFGDRVKWWITINEPWCVAALGYAAGEHAPGRKEPQSEPYLVAHNMILAHAQAVQRYRTEFKAKQRGKIGITLNMDWKEPLTDSVADTSAQRRAMDWQLSWFADPIFKSGHYPDTMVRWCGNRLPQFTCKQENMVRGSSDFFGLNHYSTDYVSHKTKPADRPNYFDDQQTDSKSDPKWPKSHIEWDIVPWGFRRLLRWIHEEYAPIPGGIIVTENGVALKENNANTATNDQKRIDFMQKYISQLWMALTEDKADVRGYLAWSFMDNFEWQHGYSQRFGLVRVDYDTQKRTPKASAAFLSELARTNLLRIPTKLMREAEYVHIATNGARPAAERKSIKPPSKDLSISDGIKILEELAAGYKKATFQNDMQLIYKRYLQDSNETTLSKARKELLMQIQAAVLPKYGFEGNTSGVMKCHVSIKALEKEDSKLLRLSEEVVYLSQKLPRENAEREQLLR